MSFIHLSLHSEYSLLRGMTRLKKAIQVAQEQGMNALAITDLNNMYGAFKFYLTCKDVGIKPLIGCELGMSQDRKTFFSVVLLAKDQIGYFQLVRLVSQAQLQKDVPQPHISFQTLCEHSDHLIVLSGSPLQSEVASLIRSGQLKAAQALAREYKSHITNYYLQLERHSSMSELESVNQTLIKISREEGIPLVATANTLYLEKEDQEAHEVLLCIGTQRIVFEKNRPYSLSQHPDFYFKTAAEMESLFADIPEAIENTQKIADMCDVTIPYGKLILPKYPIPAGQTGDSHLAELVLSGRQRVRNYDQNVVDQRLIYELEIISSKGYANYFLFIQDVVNWAKGQGIAVGPGRGSAAGSLVAYCLRITDINPLDYNLPFERFLNPDRPTPPDIDIDFADTRRDEVVSYISKRYGHDHVAQIITFGTMEARMVVRDVSRALGNTYAVGDRLAKMIPMPKQGFPMSLDIALTESSELKLAYVNEPDTKQIIDTAKKLEGLPRHASVHAAGLIVGDKPLIEHIPLQREPKGDHIITQYDMYSLDLNAVSENRAIGLVKADILGLRNLSIIESALALAKQSRGVTVDIHEVPLDDGKAYKLISEGDTFGVFQLESGGMRRLARELQPTKLSDITAMVALYRPGPMDLIPTFIAGKKDPKTVKYPHPDLKAVLAETYGILVYQEQVIEIAVVMAHFTRSQADLLRMAVGKKKKSLMEKGRKQFIEGCVEHGYTKKLAEEIFGFIEKFAAYGFNKAHAASYALIAYWTAYVKANYPVEFMTAVLTAELESATGPAREIKMGQAIEECKRLGIRLLPPDINKSYSDFSMEEGTVRFGFSAIKNIGSAAIDNIVDTRKGGPFESFSDFISRIDTRRVNKKTLESLIKVGAFDTFANRATLIASYADLVQNAASAKQSQSSGQHDLFASVEMVGNKVDSFQELPEYESAQLAQFEKELLGFVISQDPMEPYKALVAGKVTLTIDKISATSLQKTQTMAGILVSLKALTTKKDNAPMAICTLNDGTGTLDMVLFPKAYAACQQELALYAPVIVRGKFAMREGEYSLQVDTVRNLQNHLATS